jgi:hypothetical protein
MNDKLHDIARQAAEWAKKESTSPWSRHYGELYDEKFAELIVRECATAFEAEVNTWKEMDPYQGSIKRQGTKAIKKHFGVEE